MLLPFSFIVIRFVRLSITHTYTYTREYLCLFHFLLPIHICSYKKRLFFSASVYRRGSEISCCVVAVCSAVSGCCFGCCYAYISENTSASDHRKCRKLNPKLILFHKYKCACMKTKVLWSKKNSKRCRYFPPPPPSHLRDHCFVLKYVYLLLTLDVCLVPFSVPCFSCSCAFKFLSCVPALVFDKSLRFYWPERLSMSECAFRVFIHLFVSLFKFWFIWLGYKSNGFGQRTRCIQ